MKFCFSMIDCHCHLLPAVDDGSQSLEETLAVLREVRRQGVECSFLTPHVNSPVSRPGIGADELIRAMDRLCGICLSEPETYPQLYRGCEYYYDPQRGFGEEPIPLGESGYVLLELPYDADLDTVQKAVSDLQAKGYGTLLAHPEKYYAFQWEWEEASAWLRSSPEVLVQVEAWDTAEHRLYTWQFIENGLAHVLGTDSHGFHRPPVFGRAAAALELWAAGNPERAACVQNLIGGNANIFFLGKE